MTITFSIIGFILFFIFGYFLYYLTHKDIFILPIMPNKIPMPKINARDIIYCEREWICTSCKWSGKYKDTIPVMYHGHDWQNCPLCNAVVIPMEKEKCLDNSKRK